jgi:hypothetical protein
LADRPGGKTPGAIAGPCREDELTTTLNDAGKMIPGRRVRGANQRACKHAWAGHANDSGASGCHHDHRGSPFPG